jgi:hypothetical protein
MATISFVSDAILSKVVKCLRTTGICVEFQREGVCVIVRPECARCVLPDMTAVLQSTNTAQKEDGADRSDWSIVPIGSLEDPLSLMRLGVEILE